MKIKACMWDDGADACDWRGTVVEEGGDYILSEG